MQLFYCKILFFSILLCVCKSAMTQQAYFNMPSEDQPETAVMSSPFRAAFNLTKNDERNIKYRAKNVVVGFMNLLNTIATGLDLEVSETESIIRRSYLSDESKIFFDSAVILQDDLRKIEEAGLAKQKTAYHYLRDFEIFYKKSDSASVFFHNIEVSNIKSGNYLYIKVSYDCQFRNKSKISDEPFPVQKRVAELRVEKLNNRWKAWVVDIHFEDSTDRADAFKNDIPIVETSQDSSDNLQKEADTQLFHVPAKSVVSDPEERERSRRKNDSIRNYMAFRILVDSGKHAMNKGFYIIAYQFFNEAEMVVNGSSGSIAEGDREFLRTMIRETKRNIDISHRSPEEIYNGYMNDAMLQTQQRNYEQAIASYSKALKVKPTSPEANSRKQDLVNAVSNLARLNARYLSGKYKEAIREYDQAIKNDATNSDYYLGRGKCFEKIREPRKAMSDYNQAIALDAGNIDAYKMKAALHESLRAYPEAIAAYTLSSTMDKTDESVFSKIAGLHIKLNKPKEAIIALDRGIELNPKSSRLLFEKAEIHFHAKAYQDALIAYTHALRLDTSNANAWFKRGMSNFSLSQVTLAADDFNQARKYKIDQNLDIQTKTIAANYFQRGQELLRLSKPDSALRMMNSAILIDPGNVSYLCERGNHFLRLNHLDSAFRDFNIATNLDPSYFSSFYCRGITNYRLSKYTESIEDFTISVKLDPKSAESMKYLGDAQLALRDFPNAVKQYDAALTISKSRRKALPDTMLAGLYNHRAIVSMYLGDQKQALQNIALAIQIDKQNAQYYYTRGAIYLNANEPGEAESSLLKAISAEPGNAVYNNALGQVYLKKSNPAKSLNYFDVAIRNDKHLHLYPEPNYHRANAYVALGDYHAALNDLKLVRNSSSEKKFKDLDVLLGHVYLYLEKPDSAFVYFDHRNQLGLDAMSLYGTAIVYLQKNQVDRFFTWLEKSLATGKLPRNVISSDKRINSVRNDKLFRKLMKKYY